MRKIIYERSGIWFADAKKYVLESRLTRRLEELGLESFEQYAAFLSIGPYREDEFGEMFNRITINETSFFRNGPQMDFFEQRVLSQLLQARARQKHLRIWSACCSSGEEAYTLAIQVHRSLGIRLADWRIEILGTDISERVLVAAQAGRYPRYAIQSVSPLVLARYFRQEGDQYQIDPTIQSMVQFEQLNLKEQTAAARHGMWDVIFCRNAMIYFDQPMRDGCLQMFHRLLAPDGTFFVGHSETLTSSTLFDAMQDPQAFAYVKRGREANRDAA